MSDNVNDRRTVTSLPSEAMVNNSVLPEPWARRRPYVSSSRTHVSHASSEASRRHQKVSGLEHHEAESSRTKGHRYGHD